MSYINAWTIIGSIIITGLAVVAMYYHVLLHKKRLRDQEGQRQFEQTLNRRKTENKNSIVVIARAVLDKQVTYTEASIRINALMPTLQLPSEVVGELEVFSQLAEATAHIPILDRWKALSRKEKKDFDKERESIEKKFVEFVDVAAAKIVKENILASSKQAA